MAAFLLPDNQQVAVAIAFTDAAGNPAPVSNLTAVIDNTAIATVAGGAEASPVASASVIITAVGPLGSATLTVTGSNADGSVVTGTLAIDVVAGDAVSIVLTPGTPSAIPVVAPPVVAPVAPTV